MVPLRRRRRRRREPGATWTCPADGKGLLLGEPDDEWLACADGPTVAGSPKVPCSEPHDWRAVTTIKLGEPERPLPRRPAGRGDDPRLLLRLGRGLARLPRRLRLRLHVVPRGRVEGGQPPVGLLGEDGPMTRTTAGLAAVAARRRAAHRLLPAGSEPDAGATSAAAERDVGRRPPSASPTAAAAAGARRRACYASRYDEAVAPGAEARRCRATDDHTARRSRSASSTRWSTATCSPSTPTGCRRRSPTLPAGGSRRTSAARRGPRRLSCCGRCGSPRPSSSPTPAPTGTAATSSRSPATRSSPRSPAACRGSSHRPRAAERYAMCGTAEPGTAGFQPRRSAPADHTWRRAAHGRHRRPRVPRRREGPRRRPGPVPGRGRRRGRRRPRLPLGLRVAHRQQAVATSGCSTTGLVELGHPSYR